MINMLIPVQAKAEIEGHGYIMFTQYGKNTIIETKLHSLPPGKHGFHIHEKGTIEKGCDSLCAHYNPHNAPHGGPGDDKHSRHVGDLGNITVDKDGNCEVYMIDGLVELDGKYSVVGRSVVIHADEDDLGRGGDEESNKTGNAGKRIACGRIVLEA